MEEHFSGRYRQPNVQAEGAQISMTTAAQNTKPVVDGWNIKRSEFRP
jgi:hypothetical protein